MTDRWQFRTVTQDTRTWRVVAVPAKYGDIDVRGVPSDDVVHIAGPFNSEREANDVRNQKSKDAWVAEQRVAELLGDQS